MENFADKPSEYSPGDREWRVVEETEYFDEGELLGDFDSIIAKLESLKEEGWLGLKWDQGSCVTYKNRPETLAEESARKKREERERASEQKRKERRLQQYLKLKDEFDPSEAN